MKVTVRLFAILRAQAETDSIDLVLDEGTTVAEALTALRSKPGLSEVLERLPVRMAGTVNTPTLKRYSQPADELALVPPVSGGSDVHARVTEDSLSVEGLALDLAGAGAIVILQGRLRT